MRATIPVRIGPGTRVAACSTVAARAQSMRIERTERDLDVFRSRSSNVRARRLRSALGGLVFGLACTFPILANAQDAYERRGPDRGGWQVELGWGESPRYQGERFYEYDARSPNLSPSLLPDLAPNLWGEPALPSDVGQFEALLDFGELIVLRGETVWRPYAALGWRPFTDGAWDYEAARGWVWSGSDPWSAITDHTGVWRDDADMGWIWSPAGRSDWSPARVAWRIGAGLIGWAPLGPDGEADPRHFVFIPLDGLIAPGQTAALGPAESRAVYGRTRALSSSESLRLSPADLAVYGQAPARSTVAALPEVSPEVVREPLPPVLPEALPPLQSAAPPATPRFDTTVPGGRFEAGPDLSSEGAPIGPVLRTPPPVPTQRPADVAALPSPATTPAAPPSTPRQSVEAPSTAQPATSAPTVNAEVEAPGTDAAGEGGPRVVGPQWLSNGDCSSRGIREGRCRTE